MKRKQERQYSYNDFQRIFLNRCPRCSGTGEVRGIGLHKESDLTCPRCGGTGQASKTLKPATRKVTP